MQINLGMGSCRTPYLISNLYSVRYRAVISSCPWIDEPGHRQMLLLMTNFEARLSEGPSMYIVRLPVMTGVMVESETSKWQDWELVQGGTVRHRELYRRKGFYTEVETFMSLVLCWPFSVCSFPPKIRLVGKRISPRWGISRKLEGRRRDRLPCFFPAHSFISAYFQ